MERLVGLELPLAVDLIDALFLYFGEFQTRHVGRMAPVEVGDVGLLVQMSNKFVFLHSICTILYIYFRHKPSANSECKSLF